MINASLFYKKTTFGQSPQSKIRGIDRTSIQRGQLKRSDSFGMVGDYLKPVLSFISKISFTGSTSMQLKSDPTGTALPVLSHGHWFQVPRINTGCIPAKMIECKTIWDFPDFQFIGYPVSTCRYMTKWGWQLNSSVSTDADRSRPFPARRLGERKSPTFQCPVDLIPESRLENLSKSHVRILP